MMFGFDSVCKYIRQASGWETLSTAAEETSSIESRVDIVAPKQIQALGIVFSAPRDRVLSVFETKLASELIQKIATYFTLQDCASFSLVAKGMHALLLSEESQREICPILYRDFEKQYLKLHSNIRNLDKLGAGPKLGLPEYSEPEPKSIGSLKDHMNFLHEAGLLAQLSEDRKVVIVTIPKNWSIENTEVMSQAAVAAGIPSAAIIYSDPSCRTALQNNPIGETQRVAISNTLIRGSRNKSLSDQKKFLKTKGLEEGLINPLIALTIAVLRRILSKGKLSSYGDVKQAGWLVQLGLIPDRLSAYTSTKETPEAQVLTICSALRCVSVSNYGFIGDDFGVGASLKFEEPGT